ncbi:MAG TPA: carbohydrate ABC transporter permease [Firmicutes bacterium]|jgi:putative aldouronate transport system permease protein|nr:carbohydrate ABC transporter permease [Bacillota bacterium]
MASIRRTKEDWMIDIFCAIVALFILFITIYPIYYCLIYSLNDGKDAVSGGFYLLPRQFTLENYRFVFRDQSIYLAFFVTITRTVVGTIISVFFTAMVAYGLSRKYLLFRKAYLVFGIITIYFGGGLIPSYLLYRELHLIDTIWVYIIPPMFYFFNALLFVAYFSELPQALEESAKIDGAGYFTIFSRIFMPLSTPIIATIALFVGVWHWNDWFYPAFYITNEKLMTLPAVLMRVMSLAQAQQELSRIATAYQTPITLQSIRYATLVVAIAPISLIYPFLQRYFIKGMLIGAIKE